MPVLHNLIYLANNDARYRHKTENIMQGKTYIGDINCLKLILRQQRQKKINDHGKVGTS